MFKNVAASFMVFAFDTTTGAAKTGDAANITAYVSKDYGAVTVLADTSAAEMEATNAKGYYLFAAAQGETNGDVLLVSAKSGTANISVIGAPAVIFTRPTTGWLAPTTAARTLTVDASGRALCDVDTIKTNAVVNGGTITFPTTATLASTTNITAGTITTVTTTTTATNVTTVNGLAAGVITAASIATGAIDADSLAADAGTEIAAAVWDMDATAHQTQGTFGQAIGDPVADTGTLYKAVVTDAAGATIGVDIVAVKAETASIQTDTNDLQTQVGTAGAGLTNINLPNQTMDIVGSITGNLSGSVGSVTGAVGSVTGAVGSVTGAVGSVTGLTAADVGAIKTKTDSLTFTVASSVDCNVQLVNDVVVTGTGAVGDEWGP